MQYVVREILTWLKGRGPNQIYPGYSKLIFTKFLWTSLSYSSSLQENAEVLLFGTKGHHIIGKNVYNNCVTKPLPYLSNISSFRSFIIPWSRPDTRFKPDTIISTPRIKRGLPALRALHWDPLLHSGRFIFSSRPETLTHCSRSNPSITCSNP